MEYNAFLLFLNQIENQRKAKVVVQGSIIFIETSSQAEHWSLSTKILSSSNKKLGKSLGLYTGIHAWKWQEKGAYLKVDPETDSLYLVQEISSFKRYLPFKYLIEDFASIALEWKEILQDQDEEDTLIPSFI
jgi:hypothetical protein